MKANLKHLYAFTLLFILTVLTACSAQNLEQLTPLQQAQYTISALNNLYIPSRTVYENYYSVASDDVKKELNKNVNPIVNKANDTLIYASQLVLNWVKVNEKPSNVDSTLEEATSLVKEAVNTISTNIEKSSN